MDILAAILSCGSYFVQAILYFIVGFFLFYLVGCILDMIKSIGKWHLGRKLEKIEMLVSNGDSKAVDLLIIMLKDKNADARQSAVEALVKMGVLSIDPLISVLNHNHPNVRWSAAVALGKIGDAKAVEPLVAVLKDGDYHVRWSAAEALVKIGSPSVDPLIVALKNSRSDVRQLIVELFGKIGDIQAVEPLTAVLNDSNCGVRQSTAGVLDKLGWKSPTDAASVAYWIAKRDWERCVEMGALCVEPLMVVLKDRDVDVRQSAARVLGKIGDPKVVDSLIAALKDNESDVRRSAAEALGEIGCAKATDPLVAALKDITSDVRRSATESLGKIGDPKAVDPLLVVLKDGDCHVRQSVANALDKLGWNPSTDAVSATYWIAKSDWERCIEIGIPSIGPLIAMIENSNSDVYQPATKALAKVAKINMNSLETTDVQEIVEAAAISIRRLYSRTQTITDSYWNGTSCTEGATYIEPDPDIAGIRELIAILPESLHSQVAALSGEAIYLFKERGGANGY
jgi:HEAT repeat protein